MTDASCAVVVAPPDDPLGQAVAAALRQGGSDVLRAVPTALADLRVNLSGDAFIVEGRVVGAVIFRVPPDTTFSEGFALEDRAFCDTETRAVWLAASHLPSVLAVNRYDPDAWFGGGNWTWWRRPLCEAGVPLVPFTFGDVSESEGLCWHPYASRQARPAPGQAARQLLGTPLTSSRATQASFVVAGEVIEGEVSSTIASAAARLAEEGVQVATITTDAADRVLLVDPLPTGMRPVAVQQAAHLIARLCHAHMRRR